MEAEKVDNWLFTEEALTRMRRATHDRTLQVLHGASGECSERRQGARDPPKPLSPDESSLLVQLHLQRLQELCRKCGAPSDVLWTSIVFFQRFYVVRSPMEFFPQQMMFACVHLATKIEEVHEITLDALFEHAEAFGVDESLKAKVAGLEMHLLEALGFALLVEPKPDIALRMLAEELQRLPAWGGVARGLALHPESMESTWQEVLSGAEQLLVHLSIRTDAILQMPASLLITAALGSVLARHLSLGSDAGHLLNILQSLLESSVEDCQKATIRSMFQGALQDIERVSSLGEITDDSVKETVRNALRCHRAFELLRAKADERHEANRKERKRRWGEMKDENAGICLHLLRRALPS